MHVLNICLMLSIKKYFQNIGLQHVYCREQIYNLSSLSPSSGYIWVKQAQKKNNFIYDLITGQMFLF